MNILTSATRVQLKWNLENNTEKYQKTMEMASSGYKFTECSDDVVTYSKVAKFDNKLSQYDVIKDNISVGNDVLNLVSEVEGNVLNNIAKIKDLCLQISNETFSSNEREQILKDIRSRLDYIDYVASSTDYNEKNLLDGSINYYQIQIDSKQTLDISSAMTDVHVNALGIEMDPSITGETWTTQDIQTYMQKLDTASNFLTNIQTKTGAVSMSLDNSFDLAEQMDNNYVESKSSIADVDYGKITSELVKNQILQQLSVNVMVQANQMAAQTFSLLYPKN